MDTVKTVELTHWAWLLLLLLSCCLCYCLCCCQNISFHCSHCQPGWGGVQSMTDLWEVGRFQTQVACLVFAQFSHGAMQKYFDLCGNLIRTKGVITRVY